MDNINIAFFGSPVLGEVCLSELIRCYSVKLVVTKPDRVKGRGKRIEFTPVKKLAQENNISLYQPEKIDDRIIEVIKRHSIDLIVVVAYGKILPQILINYPRFGCLNLHASLLPKYRGPSPIQSVILMGEKKTGITLQIMEKKLDAGDIIASKEILIPESFTAENLLREIVDISPSFLVENIENYLSHKIEPVHQDEHKATYCSIIKKEDGLINWMEEEKVIINKIRAFNVWPVCYSYLDGKVLRIFNASYFFRSDYNNAKPGEIIETDKKNGIIVKTGKGCIKILELQVENKKRMKYNQFINGYRHIKGKILSWI